MAVDYNINQNRYSVELTRLVKVILTLSTGEKLKISNPEEQINKLLKFIEDPKNRFLHIVPFSFNLYFIVSIYFSYYFLRLVYLPKNG